MKVLFESLMMGAYAGISFIAGFYTGKSECSNPSISERTVSSYKNCIVIDKQDNILVIDSCGKRVDLNATNYELSLYQLGDTIK